METYKELATVTLCHDRLSKELLKTRGSADERRERSREESNEKLHECECPPSSWKMKSQNKKEPNALEHDMQRDMNINLHNHVVGDEFQLRFGRTWIAMFSHNNLSSAYSSFPLLRTHRIWERIWRNRRTCVQRALACIYANESLDYRLGTKQVAVFSLLKHRRLQRNGR